jgi:hypothetical protein
MKKRRTRQGGAPVKRLYFLLAVASLQIIVGSITILDAAQPVRISQPVFVPSGAYYHFDFGILGAGRLSANVSASPSRAGRNAHPVRPGPSRLRTVSRRRCGLSSPRGTPDAFRPGRGRLETKRDHCGGHHPRRWSGARRGLSDAERLVLAPCPRCPRSPRCVSRSAFSSVS